VDWRWVVCCESGEKGSVGTSEAEGMHVLVQLGMPGTPKYLEAIRKGDSGRALVESARACREHTRASKDSGGSGENKPVPMYDLVWDALRNEARHFINTEPLLASHMFSCVLNHRSIGDAACYVLATALSSELMPGIDLLGVCHQALVSDASIEASIRDDLLAAVARNPASLGFLDEFLYSKGFHALQAYRVAHALWSTGRRPAALFLQRQISSNLQVDIHPAAVLGAGVFLDHATGVVIGETTVVGNDVTLLQNVTLGGVGRKATKRHPTVRDGVLMAAGASVLGDVHVGQDAQVGACSLVFSHVNASETVLGVPAKPVKDSACASMFLPALSSDAPLAHVHSENNSTASPCADNLA